VGDLEFTDEPLLAQVFGFIEERYRDRISLSDAARAVGLTPGHLTTVVRRKTGRTVGEWIAERRMAEARRLLGPDRPWRGGGRPEDRLQQPLGTS
jgi:AraC-like DNA-binding protein